MLIRVIKEQIFMWGPPAHRGPSEGPSGGLEPRLENHCSLIPSDYPSDHQRDQKTFWSRTFCWIKDEEEPAFRAGRERRQSPETRNSGRSLKDQRHRKYQRHRRSHRSLRVHVITWSLTSRWDLQVRPPGETSRCSWWEVDPVLWSVITCLTL